MSKKIMIIDFEGKSTVRPYNLGIVIGDRKGNICSLNSLCFSFAFQENIQSKGGKIANQLTIEKINTITESVKNREGQFLDVTLNQFIYAFNCIIDKYNITEVWAYNMAFDKSALRRLIGDKYFTELCKKVEFFDMIPMVLPKLLTKKYIKYCKKNGYISEKSKSPQYKAEVVYRYLFDKEDYIEKHWGLNDALDEYKILCKMFTQKKKIIKKSNGGYTWKMLKEFAKDKNITL